MMLIGYHFDCCFKKRVSLHKKGCTSAIEVNFIALGLDKILTLRSENKFSLHSLNRIFALSLHRKQIY